MSGTGENEMGLTKILDFTRLSAIAILLLHFYFYCYAAFKEWKLTTTISDRLLINITHTGLFENLYTSKLISIGLLFISLIGAAGKKDENIKIRNIVIWLLIGLSIYFLSSLSFNLNYSVETIAITYMVGCGIGFLLVLSSGTMLSRLIHLRLSKDIFNELNESFPQEERNINNDYSINLPARYKLKEKIKQSWINIINPFRGLLVIGSPGAGKSWFVIQHVIKQHIEKGFAMFVYDFKYDDLSRIAYNWLLLHENKYSVKPSFYVINFDNLSVTHRCNPLEPSAMHDITDATESARTILLGLNREWINNATSLLNLPSILLQLLFGFLKNTKTENIVHCHMLSNSCKKSTINYFLF
ncbi:MAG: YWFCY domain-containing protein [Chitinophagaceae bacterium]